jgi:hypothetical protein
MNLKGIGNQIVAQTPYIMLRIKIGGKSGKEEVVV